MNERIHLLSCGSCRRQLDVSGLEVGDQVQCVCDTVLSVGPPTLVQVRGLACGHCGGVIGELDTQCPYCKAALAESDKEATTLCPCCAERLSNDSRHCKRCGVELRASAVPPIPRGGECPRCKGSLRVHLMEHAEVIECADGCGGMWCSRDTFDRLQRETRRATLSGDAAVERSGDSKRPETLEHQGYVPCLTCNSLMNRQQFRPGERASGIVLDVCIDHGVWFDKGELDAALAFVRRELLAGPATPEFGPLTAGGTSTKTKKGGVTPFELDGRSRTTLKDDLLEMVLWVCTFSFFD